MDDPRTHMLTIMEAIEKWNRGVPRRDRVTRDLVADRCRRGLIEGAAKRRAGPATYWEIPENAPRPEKHLAGRPKGSKTLHCTAEGCAQLGEFRCPACGIRCLEHAPRGRDGLHRCAKDRHVAVVVRKRRAMPSGGNSVAADTTTSPS